MQKGVRPLLAKLYLCKQLPEIIEWVLRFCFADSNSESSAWPPLGRKRWARNENREEATCS